MRQRKSRRDESNQLAAIAFSDAVRDILRAEGLFTLADYAAPDQFRSWDGTGWQTELASAESPAPRARNRNRNRNRAAAKQAAVNE